MRLGTTEIILIIVLALVIFGGSKVAGLGGALGKSIKDFKSAVKEDESKKESAKDEEHPTVPYQISELFMPVVHGGKEMSGRLVGGCLDCLNSICGTRFDRVDAFNDKYGEKLGSYNDALAPMEEEGFDLSRSAFDAYDSLPEEERPDEAAYVDEVARVAEEKISEIKRALGVPEDTAVEITDDGEGNVEVVADEDGDGEPETPVTEESTEESTETEEKEDGSEEEKDDEEDEEVVDDPEEIKKFEDEIRKSL